MSTPQFDTLHYKNNLVEGGMSEEQAAAATDALAIALNPRYDNRVLWQSDLQALEYRVLRKCGVLIGLASVWCVLMAWLVSK